MALLLAAPLICLAPGGAWAADETPPPALRSDPIPFKQDSDGLAELSLRAVLSLALALGIGIGGLFAMRRYFPILNWQQGKPKKRVRVAEITRVSPKSSLWVVEFDGDTLLLAQSEGKVSMLLHKPADIGGHSTATHAK